MQEKVLPSAGILDRIRAEPLFASFALQSFSKLFDGAQTHYFNAGETIAKAATPADGLWLSLGEHLALSDYQGGDLGLASVMGEEAIAGHASYMRTAVATSDGAQIRIPRQTLQDVLAEEPALTKRAHNALLGSFGGSVAPATAKIIDNTNQKAFQKHFLGWAAALISPILVLLMGSVMSWDLPNTIFISILCATVCMWVFSLVDEFVPPLFAVAAMLLVDLAPTSVVLSGFASSGLILFVAVYVLGGVMVATGLSYRLIVLLRTILPDTAFWHGFSLVISGYALSPSMPSANARLALLLPFYRVYCSNPNIKVGSRAHTRLAAAVFCGSMNMSPMFLTSKSANLIILAMLSTQLQDEFQGMFWFVAALVCAAVMTVGHFVLEQIFFAGPPLPVAGNEKLRLQASLLGPLRTDEWFALSALALFIFGALTTSWHHVALPWIGGFILVALLLYGLVSKKNFQQYVDWPMVFFLLSLQGITSTMDYLHIVDQLKPLVRAAAAIVNEEFWRVVLVELVVVSIVRLALPITAGAVVSVILLLPLAEATGVNPWVVGFIAAMFSDMWFMPYQSSNYAQLRGAQPKAEMFDEPLFLRYNLATCAVRLLAVFASIPYWQYLGLA